MSRPSAWSDLDALETIRRLPKLWTVTLSWFHGTKLGEWSAKVQAWKVKKTEYNGHVYEHLEKDWYTTSVRGMTVGEAVGKMLERIKCVFCKAPRALKARETSHGTLRTCGRCARKPLAELEAKLFARQARRGP